VDELRERMVAACMRLLDAGRAVDAVEVLKRWTRWHAGRVNDGD